MRTTEVNIIDTDDYTHTIDMSTRTVMKRVSYIMYEFPYKYVTILITRKLIKKVLKNLNKSCTKEGTSATMNTLII